MFSHSGFRVDVDTPFSGALVPVKHYRSNERVLALMIEVRRDLYMDEETGERLDRLTEVRRTVRVIIEGLEEKTGSKHRQ